MKELSLRIAVRLMNAKLSLRRQEGQGMIEYGMIIALVAILAIAAYKLLGQKLADFITNRVLPVFNG